jgi:mono/diheme cytochrome c family protein
MIRLLLCLFLLPVGASAAPVVYQNTPGSPGENLFTTYCASCHSLQDEGIGPRLGGVTRVLTDQALAAFIRNPQRVIESGEPRAVALYARYKTYMPPFDFLKPEEIRELVAYIKSETLRLNSEPLLMPGGAATNAVAAETILAPVRKSGVRIEVEDFVQFPFSSEKPPHTRIASMRAHPSGDGTL